MVKRHRVVHVPRRGPVIFLDANILFSAAHSPEGRSAALFALARQRYCRLVTSRYALEEARRNLADKYPGALARLKALTNWIHLCAEADALRLEKARSVGLEDPMDVPILASALGHADFLVTGDLKHFGSWMNSNVQGVTVLGLAQTLALVLGGKR
jgi:predicted nucleic acid-binding protein